MQVIATYDYDPWGKVTAVRDANGNLVTYPSASNLIAFMNPLRYRGYYQDNDTGFYYLQSRYYDPELKRFINADSYSSTGQGLLGYNMFSYCSNNQIIYRFCWEICSLCGRGVRGTFRAIQKDI